MADPGGGKAAAQTGGQRGGLGGQHPDDESALGILPQRLQRLYRLPPQPQQGARQRGVCFWLIRRQLLCRQRHPAGKQQGIPLGLSARHPQRTADRLPGQRGLLLRQIAGKPDHPHFAGDAGVYGAAVRRIGADLQHGSGKGRFGANGRFRRREPQRVAAAQQTGAQQSAQQAAQQVPPLRRQAQQQSRGRQHRRSQGAKAQKGGQSRRHCQRCRRQIPAHCRRLPSLFLTNIVDGLIIV